MTKTDGVLAYWCFIGSAVIFQEELTATKLLSSGLILLGLVVFVLSNRVKKGEQT